MIIKEVLGDKFPIEPNRSKKVKDSTAPSKVEKADKVEVSSEAKSLYSASRAKKLEEVEQKIDEGFYLQREATEYVADAILKDLGVNKP